MSGRHGSSGVPTASMPRSVKVLVGVLSVVAVAGSAAFAVTFSNLGEDAPTVTPTAATSECTQTDNLVVAVDPSIATAVEAVVATIDPEKLGCASFTVVSQDSARTYGDFALGGSGPAIWIPDSSEWLDKAGAAGRSVSKVSDSVASTPVITVSKSGETTSPASWIDVLAVPGLHIGDPLSSAVSSAPIVAAFAETQARGGDTASISAALVPVAQAQLGNVKEAGSTIRIEKVAEDSGTAVTTEQTFIAYMAAHPDARLTAAVPTSGTVFMNYPMALTGESTALPAAQVLADALTSASGRTALSGLGFRAAGNEPLPSGGVGIITPLVPSDPSVVATALARYEILSRPSRALAVVDVSGSMDYVEGGVTRMAATAQAGDIAIRMFPANAQLGLWAFSIDLGDGTDYRELEPVARMDAPEGDTDHRTKLLSHVDELPSLVGGGTGLYDSVLAAFRQIQSTYDPSSINSVILLTDGANDDPSGISREELLDTLARERDAARPVPIITIGVTGDADTEVLKQISAVTGGNSHFAPTPADIPKVFVGAISGRGN
ncbi:VWA domain-containing protein [Rhodococcus sp. WS3]|nr:VWA domain-containing protein [Rhodococcus sp. WS3]